MSALLLSRVGPRASAAPPRQLSAVVAGWRRDGNPDAAGFLARHPDLAADRSAVLYLGYEEFCLRENAGEFERGACDVEAFVNRFPTYRADLVPRAICGWIISE